MKKELGIGILFVLLCVVVSIMNPRFLIPYNLQNNARLIGMYGIFSIGLGVVIITGGIDLSVGSVFAFLGVILARLLTEQHWPWPVAVGAVFLTAILIGVWHGWLICWIGLQPFIVTLCSLLTFRSHARDLAHDETKGFGTENFGILRELATGSYHSVPMPFIIMIVVAVVMWIVLHRSVYGRYLYAVGRNAEAARYSGVNSKLVIASAYVVCMLLTALAGVILALDTNSVSASDFGLSYELYGIAAAVLGGCSLRGGEGSIIGIVIGTALLQVLQNIVNLLGIPSAENGAVMGYVILAGAFVDQVLGERRRRKVVLPATLPLVPAPSK